ncbi:MAG: nucleotidyltransferase domain-containing protein [bacterium]|nr:nucleotidyltransferase domain-containing protein [bacterium]
MNNRENEILRETIDVLKEGLNPSRIILFGSRAKGNNDKNADFDFAVDCKRPKISVQRKISEEIEKISGLYKVDIVYMLSVDEEFRKIILKTGEVIYERGA